MQNLLQVAVFCSRRLRLGRRVALRHPHVSRSLAGRLIRFGHESDARDLLVVTENGYGKRTRVSEYPKKGRGGMGVKTVQLTEARGHLAGARVVRDGYQVMLISTGGTVIRMPVEEIKRLGRSTQGVIVMRLREGELVSSIAPVVDSGDDE